jgi:hypothetical protein
MLKKNVCEVIVGMLCCSLAGLQGGVAFAQSETVVKTEITVTPENLYASQDANLATSSSEQVVSSRVNQSPQGEFDSWIAENGMVPGVNHRNDGSMFVLVYAEQTVNAKGDPQNVQNRWVQARNVAYTTAVINAKAQIADLVAAEVVSERSSSVMDSGGDTTPPMLAESAQDLSIMAKALTLTGKALDHEIKKFDPKWDGTGIPDEEKRKRLVQTREIYKENLAAVSQLFTTGAMPVFNAEGPDVDGDYSVGVGMIWSTKTQLIASGIYDPTVNLPNDEPEPPIRAQLQMLLTENPNFLATSSGVRVWTNEKGEQTVIAIVGLDRSKSKQRNRRESGLRGRSYIAQFVAEGVESKDQASTEMVTDQLKDGTKETFDAGKFSSTVKARSKKLRLSGVTRVLRWSGKHPASKAKMLVDVWAWSPSGRQQAEQLGQMTRKAENKMRRKGAVTLPSTTSVTVKITTELPATRTRRGATTKSSKW